MQYAEGQLSRGVYCQTCIKMSAAAHTGQNSMGGVLLKRMFSGIVLILLAAFLFLCGGLLADKDLLDGLIMCLGDFFAAAKKGLLEIFYAIQKA